MPKSAEFSHYFAERPSSKPRFRLIYAQLRGIQFRFVTASGVFSKKRVDLGTRLLIESMILPEEGYVLDIGCGYGAIGIVAAALNPKLYVFMVDVNERAVKLAKKNAELNGVKNIEVKRGYLYEPVKGISFNCILSNPPVSAGIKVVREIISEAPKHMTNKATIQMVLRSKVVDKRLMGIFEETFGNCTILARGSGYRVLMAEKNSQQLNENRT